MVALLVEKTAALTAAMKGRVKAGKLADWKGSETVGQLVVWRVVLMAARWGIALVGMMVVNLVSL